MKTVVRHVTAVAGLAGLGVIIHEVLQKWHLVSQGRGILWSIIPLWLLYVLKESLSSQWCRESARLPPPFYSVLAAGVRALLIVLGILALISIPFLWFGVIEELATGGGVPR